MMSFTGITNLGACRRAFLGRSEPIAESTATRSEKQPTDFHGTAFAPERTVWALAPRRAATRRDATREPPTRNQDGVSCAGYAARHPAHLLTWRARGGSRGSAVSFRRRNPGRPTWRGSNAFK